MLLENVQTGIKRFAEVENKYWFFQQHCSKLKINSSFNICLIKYILF